MTRTKSIYLALVAVLLSPMAANADPVLISTSIGDYEVTTIVGLGYELTITQLMAQVWWGNETLAAEFAQLVGVSLGSPNDFGDDGLFGAFFAYAGNSGGVASEAWSFDTNTVLGVGTAYVHRFAVASVASVPEPGTLALLGVGLVGMATRRRKKV